MPAIPQIHAHLESEGALFLAFPTAEPTEDSPEPSTVSVAESVGALEAEYAAIRKGSALIDEPQTAAVFVTGSERTEFLNSMLTQQLIDPSSESPYMSTSSFWLNRKGRIDADLRVINTPDTTILLTDVIAASKTAESLDKYVFSEDASLVDATDSHHVLSIHGPAALKLLQDLSQPDPEHSEAPSPARLQCNHTTVRLINGCSVTIDRNDRAATIGLTLIMRSDQAAEVYGHIAEHARSDHGHNNPDALNTYRLRLAGWGAFNIARIEAGTPLFRIDFSTNNLPAETALLDQRVNFTKGCYLGQEVVARMHSLGHPKQVLVPLRAANPTDPLPIESAPLFAEDNPGTPIGAITSSTASPLLGGTPIALAQVKWNHHTPNTKLITPSEQGDLTLTINEQPAFIST